ncbi:MAG: hypothetical protein AAF851_08790 [Myxococcota bacterium]
MKSALHAVLLLAGLGAACADDDPTSDGSSVVDSGFGSPDVGTADSGSRELRTFSDFDVQACRSQSDGSVSLYAEHDSEPAGCAILTLEQSAEDSPFGVEADDGWRVRAASVVGGACPMNIPGDPSGRAQVVSARGLIDLEFTMDGFPMGLEDASVVLEVEMAAQNPFGDAELTVTAGGLVVRVCPESPDGG